jgi:hypothetical protein
VDRTPFAQRRRYGDGYSDLLCSLRRWRRSPQWPKRSNPILIVLNTIKPDKKQQHENSMLKFEAALKIAGTSDPIIKRVHEHTRVFFPTDANDDGTYTYV